HVSIFTLKLVYTLFNEFEFHTKFSNCRPKRGPSFVEIPAGCYWMESDNPNNYYDSRLYGPVSGGLLTARATHIIWPPKRWRTIKTEVFDHNTVPVSKRNLFFGI
ncbi:hypothetical protein LOAG_16234, partial [Loa loa]